MDSSLPSFVRGLHKNLADLSVSMHLSFSLSVLDLADDPTLLAELVEEFSLNSVNL